MLINFIDDYLIEFWFQPLAHKFQRLTGKDNFFLTKFCFILHWLSSISAGYLQSKKSSEIYGWSTFLIIILLLWTYSSQRNYRDASGNSPLRAMNPQRWYPLNKGLRTIIVVFAIQIIFCVHIPHILDDGTQLLGCVGLTSELSLSSGYYLIACTPLPPGTGLFRKWLDSAVGFIKSLGSNASQPMPVPG